MIGIYKITNPKGKVYIGQSINIENRFNGYKNLHCKAQPILYNSFIKYGIENHKFEIIIQCEKEQLNELEKYYQQIYSAIGEKGLNCFIVGSDDEKRLYSQFTKKNITRQKKNKKNIHKRRFN